MLNTVMIVNPVSCLGFVVTVNANKRNFPKNVEYLCAAMAIKKR